MVTTELITDALNNIDGTQIEPIVLAESGRSTTIVKSVENSTKFAMTTKRYYFVQVRHLQPFYKSAIKGVQPLNSHLFNVGKLLVN